VGIKYEHELLKAGMLHGWLTDGELIRIGSA
jgi:hypothetical protein